MVSHWLCALPARAIEYLKRDGAGNLSAVPQLGPKRSQRYGEALANVIYKADQEADKRRKKPADSNR